MKREAVVVGLDVGSTKTCAVMAEATGDGRLPKSRVLGVGMAKSGGVKRGQVRDIEETTDSIVRALRDAERMAGVKVPSVYGGVAAENISWQMETGLASVTGEEIRRQDTDRGCASSACTPRRRRTCAVL
jgi:cell division protein FtsA